ncbi:MAG: radical SAM family heme chaperone HemW [Bacilli bacterium]|nr:radical SAM family heme chaperone HemW [Bacilli bacterium]
MIGLYVHIPFCNSICSYCDFVKMVAHTPLKEQYVNALIKEIDLKKQRLLRNNYIDTIYIGGGTPSSLPLYLLDKLLTKLDNIYNINNIKEYTIELNPNDVNIDLINILIKHHINRISLGVQSFNNLKLNILKRNHNKDQAVNAIKLLNEYFDNISIDLIYGFVTKEIIDDFSLIKNDIDIAISLGVKHLSCYSLILEDKTLLKYLYEKHEFRLMDEEKEAKLYYDIRNYLINNNFKHYEISNFTYNKNYNYESIHNKIYWTNNHYEALGISAASYIDNHRIKNISSINKYIKLIENNDSLINSIIDEDIELDLNDIYNDELYLGLRLIDGINIDEFYNKYNKTIFEVFPNLDKEINNNFIIFENNNIKINPKYLYISDNIILKILN